MGGTLLAGLLSVFVAALTTSRRRWPERRCPAHTVVRRMPIHEFRRNAPANSQLGPRR